MMTWLAISRMYRTVATGVEDLTSLCHCLGTLSVLEMCGDFHIWLTVMEGVGGVVGIYILSFGVGRNRQYKQLKTDKKIHFRKIKVISAYS